MSKAQAFVLCLCFTTILVPCVAYSVQGDVTVDFGGLCPQVVLTGSPPFFLFPSGGFLDCTSGGTTYFRITDKVPNPASDADRAQIVPASTGTNTDAADDTLRFYNFKIYAVTPTPSDMPQGYTISFWREHTLQETTDGPGGTKPDRWYKTTATGSMKKVINNWIKMDPGYVTHPVGGAETALGTAKTYTVTTLSCPGSTCGITLSTSGKWPETSDSTTWLTGNRMLRVKVSFKFQNGNANPTDASSDWILLNTGAKINDQTNADPGDQEECTDQYCDCKSGITMITVTTKRMWDWMTVTTSGETKTSKAAKIEMFTKVNWASLQQDMARGSGEYLASLAALWEIPTGDQAAFFALAQEQYRTRAEEGIAKRPELLSRLHEAWESYPVLYANAGVQVN